MIERLYKYIGLIKGSDESCDGMNIFGFIFRRSTKILSLEDSAKVQEKSPFIARSRNDFGHRRMLM
jgi:hypothetical protein